MTTKTHNGFLSPGTCVADFGLACYTPQVLHDAYQIPWQINGKWAGTGQSIAIVDAYGSPTIAKDLATFSKEFGLPPANLNIYYPGGRPAPNVMHDAVANGWAGETSLDVETVHSLAPGATINLVIAASAGGNVINQAQAYVSANHLGDVMSMSYGAPEAAIGGLGNNLQMKQAEATFVAAKDAGISVFASSGDNGAGNGYSSPNALFPASSPLVTATGGTALFVPADSNAASTDYSYGSEEVWNDGNNCPFGCSAGIFGATGGAPSSIFVNNNLQPSVSGANGMRTTSDVSFNASVYTGTMIYLGFMGGNNNGFYFFGGTSEAAPSWAAITADINQARAGNDLGYLNQTLYELSQTALSNDFHDVTVGNNAFGASSGFSAGTGYDMPTGLGTPNVTNLMSTLASGYTYTASMSPPTS